MSDQCEHMVATDPGSSSSGSSWNAPNKNPRSLSVSINTLTQGVGAARVGRQRPGRADSSQTLQCRADDPGDLHLADTDDRADLGLRHKSEVSRISGLLDEQVQVFRQRPLEGRYPYVFVDAKVEKVRDGGRVARKCVVIAHAVHETGRREIIGLDVGDAETEAFWTEFLRSLVARGLVGVQLAISDAHPGLKAAIARGVCPTKCVWSWSATAVS
jgi:hypothetical protein